MSSDRTTLDRFVRRREALLALGAAGAGAVLLGRGRLGAVPVFETPEALAASACTLDPEVTAGPYHIDNALTRRDVREDRNGVLLKLTLTVLNAASCKAVPGADVEIWHADAGGLYSGYGTGPGQGATNSKRYLRGHQKANSSGQVQFLTIYPGWYRGRTPHVHLIVSVGGNKVHTGQLFFQDTTSNKVYDTAAYKGHGHADTTNAADNIYRSAGAAEAIVKLSRRSSSSLVKGFNGSATLAVKA